MLKLKDKRMLAPPHVSMRELYGQSHQMTSQLTRNYANDFHPKENKSGGVKFGPPFASQIAVIFRISIMRTVDNIRLSL
jgi:hypothetical protein